MGFLPINVEVTGRSALVVGGGEVGRRKVASLLEFGAAVRLVAREPAPALGMLIDEGRVSYLGPEYRTAHLDGAVLVVAATDDGELNARIAREARELGLLVNVVDRPELGDFIVPAWVRRGDLTVSISTAGKSPALAARLREWLEEEIGPEYGLFLDLMGKVRNLVLARGRPSHQNRDIFRRLVDSELLDALALGDRWRADEILTRLLGSEGSLAALDFHWPTPEAKPGNGNQPLNCPDPGDRIRPWEGT